MVGSKVFVDLTVCIDPGPWKEGVDPNAVLEADAEGRNDAVDPLDIVAIDLSEIDRGALLARLLLDFEASSKGRSGDA